MSYLQTVPVPEYTQRQILDLMARLILAMRIHARAERGGPADGDIEDALALLVNATEAWLRATTALDAAELAREPQSLAERMMA